MTPTKRTTIVLLLIVCTLASCFKILTRSYTRYPEDDEKPTMEALRRLGGNVSKTWLIKKIKYDGKDISDSCFANYGKMKMTIFYTKHNTGYPRGGRYYSDSMDNGVMYWEVDSDSEQYFWGSRQNSSGVHTFKLPVIYYITESDYDKFYKRKDATIKKLTTREFIIEFTDSSGQHTLRNEFVYL